MNVTGAGNFNPLEQMEKLLMNETDIKSDEINVGDWLNAPSNGQGHGLGDDDPMAMISMGGDNDFLENLSSGGPNDPSVVAGNSGVNGDNSANNNGQFKSPRSSPVRGISNTAGSNLESNESSGPSHPIIQELASLTGHSNKVSTCTISSCGTVMASGGADKKILIWNMAQSNRGSINRLWTLDGHSQQITNCRFLSLHGLVNGEFNCDDMPILLASCGYDKKVRIWNLPEVKLLKNNTNNNNNSNNQNPAYTSSSSSSSLVEVDELEAPKCITIFDAHAQSVTGVDFCPIASLSSTSQTFSSASTSSTNTSDSRPLTTIFAASLDAEGELKFWDIWTGSVLTSCKLPCSSNKSAGYSSNPLRFKPLLGWLFGPVTVATAFASTLHLIDISLPGEGSTFLGEDDIKIHVISTPHSKNISCIDWSEDGRWLISSSDDLICLWDIGVGTASMTMGGSIKGPVAQLPAQTAKISSCSFLPTSSSLSSSSTSSSIPNLSSQSSSSPTPGSITAATNESSKLLRIIFGEYECMYVWELIAGSTTNYTSLSNVMTNRIMPYTSCQSGVVSGLGWSKMKGNMDMDGGNGSGNGGLSSILVSASGAKDNNLKVWRIAS